MNIEREEVINVTLDQTEIKSIIAEAISTKIKTTVLPSSLVMEINKELLISYADQLEVYVTVKMEKGKNE